MIKKIIFIIMVSLILVAPFGDLINTCAAGGGGGGGRGGMAGGGAAGGGRGGAAAGGRGANAGFGGAARGGAANSATTSIVGTDNASSMVLLPLQQQKQIIARAPAELMRQIQEWIVKLDTAGTNPAEYDAITVKYVDVTEVADSVSTILADMESEYTQSIFIQPLAASRQLLVFGKPEAREMVKKLVQEVDIPSGLFERKTFQIKYSDPTDIKTKLDELFNYLGSSSSTGTTGTARTTASLRTTASGTASLSADNVSVIAYPALRQLTVIASADNMEKVEQMIDQWDQPIDPEKIRPRIITLKNVDPIQMATLLSTLFGSSSGSTGGTTSTTTRTMLTTATSGASTATTTGQQLVGQLYGKLTFEDVPGTKKIIVISNIPEAYDVVENLVKELDGEEMAQVPEIVQLKYADAEDLCRRLNALFADVGQTATIPLTTTGLTTPSSMGTTTTGTSTTATTTYTPPWSGSTAGSTTTSTTLPISNVFGKVRFIPEPGTKSILLLASQQFYAGVETIGRAPGCFGQTGDCKDSYCRGFTRKDR